MNRRRTRLLAGAATAVAAVVLALGVSMVAHAATLLSDDFEDGDTSGWSKSGGAWSVVSDGSRANKGLQVSNGNCTPQTPTTAPTSPTAQPTTATPSPTSPTPEPTQPSGPNLSIGAGSDGSSKASGTSYGNVRDGDMSTYWSPVGSTGSISIKWGSATTVSMINIREASGSVGNISSWRVINHDTGAVLAAGSGAGLITFPRTSLSKITFEITGSTSTPEVAEFETYAG